MFSSCRRCARRARQAFIPSLTLEDGKKLLLIALQLPRLPRLALSAAGSVSRVLEILHLSQYTDWFTAQDVDLGVLRGVTELDLDDVEVRMPVRMPLPVLESS